MKTHKTLLRTAIGFITLLLILGYASTAFAQSPPQPNYGDPIVVDGEISVDEWDLTNDHFAILYRFIEENGQVVSYGDPEADAYLRFDSANQVMNVLVISRNGQNLTPNGFHQVWVDQDDYDVSNYDTPPDGTPPDFEWYNLNGDGSFAQGWEASFDWNLAIDPALIPCHNIKIFFFFIDGGYHMAGTQGPSEYVPICIYDWDYGDLPDSYGTTLYNSDTGLYGPKHSAGALRLGTTVDGEGNGQPADDPVLDDETDRNDEDGVFTIGNWRSGTPTIQYTVNGCSAPPCYLSAWIDWGEFDTGSGSWRPDGEFNLPGDILFLNREVSNGTDTFIFDVPDEHFAVIFNARFRLCDTQDVCSTPFSSSLTDAPLGEVEDYQWEFDPTALTLKSFSASPSQTSIIIYLLAGSVLAIMILGTATFIKKRNSQ